MIKHSISTLGSRKGSSSRAIAKFVENNYSHLPKNFRKTLPRQLKRLVDAGKLMRVKNSFKLPPLGEGKDRKSNKIVF